MSGRTGRRSVLAAACLATLMVAGAATSVVAQSAGKGTGMDGGITGAGSGSDYTAPDNTITQGKGVGGTGMGKMPPAGNAMGTGNSVKGPQGQGIDAPITNSTDTAK